MKRKILWMGLSCLLVASLVLASCAKEEVVTPGEQEEEEEVVTPGEEEEEEVVVPEAGEPQYGETITWFPIWSGAPGTWYMHGQPMRCWQGAYLECLMMGDIDKYGPRGTNQYDFKVANLCPELYLGGQLAESWEITPTKHTFHMRVGVMFTANPNIGFEPRECTAEDAAFAINYYLTDPAPIGNFAERVIRATASDRYTLEIETPYFYANWADQYYLWFPVYPKEVVDAGDTDWRNWVGTGPFILKDYVEGAALTYERNPDYWGTTIVNGKEYQVPFVDELIYPLITDESTKVAALRTGKLDYMGLVPIKYNDSLAQTAPLMLKERYIADNAQKVVLRCDKGIFSDVNLRRALWIGTDFDAINRSVYSGLGSIQSWPNNPTAVSFIPMNELPASAQELYKYDTVKAKKIIADAGYPNGFTFILQTHGTSAERNDILDLWKAQLTKIGVTLDLRLVEPGQASADIYAYTYPDATMTSWGGDQYEYGQKNICITEPGCLNFSQFEVEGGRLKELYDEAMTIADAAVRRDMWKETNLYMYEKVPMLAFASPNVLHAWWPWIKNYYGEIDTGALQETAIIARVWIDQDLKAEMGYK